MKTLGDPRKLRPTLWLGMALWVVIGVSNVFIFSGPVWINCTCTAGALAALTSLGLIEWADH